MVTVESATCSKIDRYCANLILQKNANDLSQRNLEGMKFLKLMVKHNVCGLKY